MVMLRPMASSYVLQQFRREVIAMIKWLPFQCALSSSDLGFREITSGTLIEVRRLSRAAIYKNIDLTVLTFLICDLFLQLNL